jgi:hypothetical protein
LSAVILGLAIVKILQGILWMIHGRQRIKVYWVQLVWVAFTITSNVRLAQLPIYLGLLACGALAVTRNEWFHMAMAICGLLATFAMILT